MATSGDRLAYTKTFWFTAFYFLVAHGRLHLVVPFLSSVPCAMIAGLLAVFAFFLEHEKGKQPVHLIREEKLVLGLLTLCLLSIPTARWPGGAFSSLYKGFLPVVILMFITISICRTSEGIKKFTWVYFCSSMLIVLAALRKDLNHFSTSVTDMYDVNDIALVLDCCVPVLFFFMLQNRGFKRLLVAAGLFLCVLTILKTGSRGGALGLMVLVFYTILNAPAKTRTLLAASAIVVAVALLAPQGTKDRVASMISPQTEYDQNLGDRTQIWVRGVKLFLHSPLLGVGFNNYSVADGAAVEMGSWRTAHNSFLQIAVELGAVGFILFVKITLGSFLGVRSFRKRLESADTPTEYLWVIKGLEMSFLVYAVTAFFLSQAYNAQFFFLISVWVAVQKVVAKEVGRTEKVTKRNSSGVALKYRYG